MTTTIYGCRLRTQWGLVANLRHDDIPSVNELLPTRMRDRILIKIHHRHGDIVRDLVLAALTYLCTLRRQVASWSNCRQFGACSAAVETVGIPTRILRERRD